MSKGGIALCLIGVWMSLGGGGGLAEASGLATIGESGEFVELRHEAEGTKMVDRLPLYRSGHARYFSAGVGLEERMAEYPPFPLKIVFTAGGKPFLAGVSVTIQPAKGGSAIAIPREQVEGPWLFVDVPEGVYDVTAVHGGQAQSLKGVKVEAGKQKVVHLRWAEDRGIPANVLLE